MWQNVLLNKIIPLRYHIENQLLIINIVELSKMKTNENALKVVLQDLPIILQNKTVYLPSL